MHQNQRIELLKDHIANIKFIPEPTEREQYIAVKTLPACIQFIENPTEKVQLLAVSEGEPIASIKKPCKKVFEYVLKRNIKQIQHCNSYFKDEIKESKREIRKKRASIKLNEKRIASNDRKIRKLKQKIKNLKGEEK